MYEVTKWYAEDGKVFDNEDECLKYEKAVALKDIKDDFLMLDEGFKKVEDPFEQFDTVWYIYVRTATAAETLYYQLKHDWETPWNYHQLTPGAWFYSDDANAWIELDEVTEWLSKIMENAPDWFTER